MGGPVPIIQAFWNKWCDATERRGNPTTTPQNQQVWTYEQGITMRFEETRPTQSNDYLEYDKDQYQILSVQKVNEASTFFERIRCVKLATNVFNLPPVNIDNITVVNYFGTDPAGIYNFQDDDLIGKNYFGAFLDGAEFEIIPNKIHDTTTVNTAFKQCYINPADGETTWSQPILVGTHAAIQQYGSA